MSAGRHSSIVDDRRGGVDEGRVTETVRDALADLPHEQEVCERVERQPVAGTRTKRALIGVGRDESLTLLSPAPEQESDEVFLSIADVRLTEVEHPGCPVALLEQLVVGVRER